MRREKTMAREKQYYREVVADLSERSGGKMTFNCRAIMSTLKIGHSRAQTYLGGKKDISIYDLARKLIEE
jgi:hypothetical protein